MNAATVDSLVHANLPAAARGDREAYSRIVAACQSPVTAIALAIVRDVAASEDIAQEAFLSAWQHLRRLKNPASFLPWLRQITRNLARDHLRAQRHRPLDGLGAELAIASAADPAPTPAEQLLAEEREDAAADLISALPAASREVLLLYYREGQSSRQVAALLGLSDAAVRKRLSRAREALRDDLLERFGAFARDSAPSVAFTSIVATALTVAAPPAAASGLFGTMAAGAGAKTFGKVLLGGLGGVGIGLVAAFAGIYLGLRKQLKGAIDSEERIGLVRSAVINGLATLGYLVAILLIARHDEGWVLSVVATLGFMAVVMWQSVVVQARVLARRRALEARRDPVGAARRRRRERLTCWLGAVIGLGTGFTGLYLGLVSSGRLPPFPM
ncbi:MAG TPA: sigma-70 family RNA polymerase sigma factor [Xanthomonadaceae bacterium]|nr:sigma-70 family RNA polymerase sigma factor [Xanthomonadaceae bacterium]